MNADTDCAPNPEKSADVDNCNSSHLAHKEDVRLRHFHPSREMFHLILERSHSYRDLLEGGESFARHLGVPLISDDVARGICEIFQVPRPYVLGPENGGCGGSVSWLDVVQETDYQAEPQQGGTYHCRLHDQGVWVQLSNCQHELLLTGLPQRLIHPWSYEKDVRTELETLALAITEISKWETLASEGEHVQDHVLFPVQSLILCRSPGSHQRCAYESSEKDPRPEWKFAIRSRIRECDSFQSLFQCGNISNR